MTDPKTTEAANKVVDVAADAIKAAAASNKEPSDAKTKQAAERKGKPIAYTAPHPVYVDSRYYKEGEVFVTGAPKGEEWVERTSKEVAAIAASTDSVPDDANLDEASKSALQAVAIIKHVNITGLDKPALITAIKAAYEPHL